MIAMSEVKTAVPEADPHYGGRATGKEHTR
jgi:hypothetical protein